MNKKYINRFLKKLTLISFLTLFIAISTAAIAAEKFDNKKWIKTCDDKQDVCIIGIKKSKEQNGKEFNLVTAFISIGSKTERQMNLVDGEEKTYKLDEKNISVPILNFHFPLNVDLTKRPLLQIDKKNISNLSYTHCNNQVGCSTTMAINDNILELLKSGKEISLVVGVYAVKENMVVKLPLKGFTKSYNNLLQ